MGWSSTEPCETMQTPTISGDKKITNSQFSSFRAHIWQNRMWKKVIKQIAVHPKVNVKRINCVTNQLPFKMNRGSWRNEASSWSSKTELLVVNNGCFLLNALVWTLLIASVSSKLDCLLTWLECHKATQRASLCWAVFRWLLTSLAWTLQRTVVSYCG